MINHKGSLADNITNPVYTNPMLETTKAKYIDLARDYVREHKQLGRNHSLKDIATVFEYLPRATDRTLIAEVLCETKVRITYLKTDAYFPDDKDVRDIYTITVTRDGKKTSFKFGASINMTERHEKPSLYHILTSIASDYSAGQYDTLEEFCDNYGYDTDSRKAEKLYHEVRKQYWKLSKLFSAEEIQSFPG